jgi:hypothetical protein
MYIGLHVKYRLFLSDCNGTWTFATDFQKNIQKPKFMKICPVGAEFFHADWQTDRHDKIDSRFSATLRKAPEIENNEAWGEKKIEDAFWKSVHTSGAGCAFLRCSAQTQLNLFGVHRRSVGRTRTPHDPDTKPAVLRCACVINDLSARRDRSHVTKSNGLHKNNDNEV